MKRKVILGIVIFSTIFSFMGCNNYSKEVVLDGDGSQEEKFTIERISNEENGEYYINFYDNGEYYASKIIEKAEEEPSDEAIKKVNIFVENFYKINKENKFEKTNKKTFNGDGEEYIAMEMDKDAVVLKGLTYINNKTGETKTFKTYSEQIKLEGTTAGIIKGKDNMSFLGIAEKDNSLLEIINMETNESIKLKGTIKGTIKEVIYMKSYYVITEDFKIYKLKEQGKELVVEKSIDLIKEFGIKPHEGDPIIEKICLKANGDMYIDSMDNNNKQKHSSKCGEVLLKYNLLTGNKSRIEYALEENMSLAAYNEKSDLVVLSKTVARGTEDATSKIYLGKISNDKIEILEEVKLSGKNTFVFDIDFNEDGTEGIISYRISSEKGDVREYLKFKLK